MILSINNKELSSNVQATEVYEIGELGNGINGTITTIGDQTITVNGEDYDYIYSLWCESDGCGIYEAVLLVCGRKYELQWFVQDCVIVHWNKTAELTLTDNGFGSKIKQQLDTSFIVPDKYLEEINALEMKPTPSGVTWNFLFKAVRVSELFEFFADRYGFNLAALPSEFDDYVITTRGGLAYVTEINGIKNGDATPKIDINISRAFEVVYKLLNYVFVFTGDELKFVRLADRVNTKTITIAKECEKIESKICENWNLKSVKLGGKEALEYNSEEQRTSGETPVLVPSSIFSNVLNEGNFKPSKWEVENGCGGGRDLDLSLDWLIIDSNEIEKAIYRETEQFIEDNDDLFIIHVSGGATVRTSIQNPLVSDRFIYNRALWNNEIVNRFSCELTGSTYFDNPFFNSLNTQTDPDGLQYPLTDYSGVGNVGFSSSLWLKQQGNSQLVQVDIFSNNNTRYVPQYDHYRTFNLDYSFSLTIAPTNQALLGAYNVRFRLYINNISSYVSPFVTFLQDNAGTNELNGNVCYQLTDSFTRFVQKGTNLDLRVEVFKASAGGIIFDPSQATIALCNPCMATSVQDEYEIEDVEPTCTAYKYCHDITTHIDPCCEIDGFGLVTTNGKAIVPYKIERSLNNGLTKIFGKTINCV